MNEDPEKSNTEIEDALSNPDSQTIDTTLEHSDHAFEPDNYNLANEVDFVGTSTEMPDTEVEPPTVGEKAEPTNEASSNTEEFDDMLVEPRDEVNLMQNEGPLTDTNAAPDTTRTPLHSSEIHDSIHQSTTSLITDEAAPELQTNSSFATSEFTTTPTQPPEVSAFDMQSASDSLDNVAVESPSEDSVYPKKQSFWNKKHAFATLIIVALVVVLFGGAAFAYKGWYQNPDKVLSDGVVNFLNAKSMTYSGALSSGSTLDEGNVSFNGGVSGDTMNANIDASLKSGDTQIDVPIALVGQKDAVYFKLSNLKKLESQLLSPLLMLTGADQNSVDSLVKSIDGTWYKVTPSDLNESSKDKQTDTCVSNVIDKIRHDGTTQKELITVYKKHPLFILQKTLGSKNGSLGYRLTPVSDVKANEFSKALQTTSIYTSLVKCDSSFKSMFAPSETNSSTPSKASVDIWVSRWGHQITKITASSNDETKLSLTFVPKVGDETAITIPANAKSVNDLKSQFMKLEQSMEAQANQAEAQANQMHEEMLKMQAQQSNGAATMGGSSKVQAIVQ